MHYESERESQRGELAITCACGNYGAHASMNAKDHLSQRNHYGSDSNRLFWEILSLSHKFICVATVLMNSFANHQTTILALPFVLFSLPTAPLPSIFLPQTPPLSCWDLRTTPSARGKSGGGRAPVENKQLPLKMARDKRVSQRCHCCQHLMGDQIVVASPKMGKMCPTQLFQMKVVSNCVHEQI